MNNALTLKQVILTGKITKADSGVIEFLDGGLLAGQSWFRTQQLREYQNGDVLECIFRVNEKKRYLLNHKLIAGPSFGDKAQQKAQRFPHGWHAGVYFDHEAADLFDTALKAVDEGHVIVLMFRGESGYGKTSYPAAFAEEVGMRCVEVNCASILDTEEWWGYREAQDGSTVFIPTELTEALIEGNCVIVLDEANRVESWISNSLLPMLDHRRRTRIHNHEIVAGERIVIVMTINEGWQFSGTFTMDAALKNRIDGTHKVGPMEPKFEAMALTNRYPGLDKNDARNIIDLVTSLRKIAKESQMSIDVSTRTALKLAFHMSLGKPLATAAKVVIQNVADDEEAKPIIDMINQKVASYQVSAPTSAFDEDTIYKVQIRLSHPIEKSMQAELVKAIRQAAGIDFEKAKERVQQAIDTRQDIGLKIKGSAARDLAVDVLKRSNLQYQVF